MRLITSQELSERTEEELQALFNTVSKALALEPSQGPTVAVAMAAVGHPWPA